MTRPIHWSGTAIEHLAAVARYIGRTSPIYAERVVDRVLRRVDLLSEFPELGHVVPEARDENVREIIEGPYRILYLAQPTRVDVLAIVHGRQLIEWPK